MLTVPQLKELVAQGPHFSGSPSQLPTSPGKIDTVNVAFTDMYGRMMGKRFDAEFFVSDGIKSGTHACDYLLASDMDMDPIPGFEYANWERGERRRTVWAAISRV